MSKKFKFKLASVLKYRKILKEQQEVKLMQANRACQETEALINDLDQRRHEVYQSMIENLAEGFSLTHQSNHETFNQMILTDKSREKSRLAKRRKSQEFENAKYIRCARDLKAIENYQDKTIELHQKVLLEEEMKQIDDLVNSRFGVKFY